MNFSRRNFFLIGISFALLTFSFSCSSDNSSPAEKKLSADEEFSKKVSGHYSEISIKDFADGFNHARYLYPNSIPPWELYETDQILGLAENMLYHQNPDGGWAKNLDLQRKYTLTELEAIQKKNESVPPVTYKKQTSKDGSTIDNGNIFSQIKYLVQVYRQVPDSRYIDCAVRALQWILNAQHPLSGGFTGADVYAITYNDDVMSQTIRILRDISRDDKTYGVFPKKMRENAEIAYQKGIDCILKTQITITLSDGSKILTAWGQQHSHETLEPLWAREFEPPSICTSESAKIVNLLIEDQEPSEEIKKAITAACEWFDSDDVRIKGKEIIKKPHEAVVLNNHHYDFEKIMVDDKNALDLWARFYALDSSFDLVTGARKAIQGTYPPVNSPVWCDRGCKYCPSFNDLSMERRNGYAYTVRSPASTLEKYRVWKTKFGN
ncbi:pectate lyase [Treponema sp. UBA3813]|uniref:pectate lyase n=1 Tax=Treponema sp. UBA3813 TaxID=1947715 RepID=UPI0025DE4B54|nr:pectate lyase [Treponema sp. UBA3813]